MATPTQSSNSSLFVSDKQLAERYGVHRATIWRWASDPDSGFPGPVRLSQSCTRWSMGQVLEWEEAKGVA